MEFTCGEWVRQGFGFANPNLAAKWFGGWSDPLASVAYEYSRDGQIVARTVLAAEIRRGGGMSHAEDAENTERGRY